MGVDYSSTYFKTLDFEGAIYRKMLMTSISELQTPNTKKTAKYKMVGWILKAC